MQIIVLVTWNYYTRVYIKMKRITHFPPESSRFPPILKKKIKYVYNILYKIIRLNKFLVPENHISVSRYIFVIFEDIFVEYLLPTRLQIFRQV